EFTRSLTNGQVALLSALTIATSTPPHVTTSAPHRRSDQATRSRPASWQRAFLMFTALWNQRNTMPLLAVLMLLAPHAPAPTPARVDLRHYQPPIQTQGNRNTCCSFASLAALEAAYRRAGYPDLKLSEQFANHLAQTLCLTPGRGGADRRETRVAANGGGSYL